MCRKFAHTGLTAKVQVLIFSITIFSCGASTLAQANAAMSLDESNSILIAGPDANLTEFEAFVHVHPHLTRLSDFEIQNSPSPQLNQSLLDQFIHAKERYFSGDTKGSLQLFRKIMNVATEESWSNEIRPLFFDTSLYLAILDREKDRRANWIQESLRWRPSRILWSEWPLDLKHDFERALTASAGRPRIQFSFWNLRIRKANWNGLPLDLQTDQKVPLFAGHNRLVLFDDQHVPTVTQIKGDSSEKKSPDVSLEPEQPRQVIVSGTCERPQLLSEYDHLNVAVFFSSGCVWDKSDKGVWHKLGASEGVDADSSGYYNAVANWPKPVEASDHFYQKPLFWVAVVGVIAVAVKLQLDQSNRSADSVRVAMP